MSEQSTSAAIKRTSQDITTDSYAFFQDFVIDVDIFRCRHCYRGIHITRHEPFAHATDCPNTETSPGDIYLSLLTEARDLERPQDPPKDEPLKKEELVRTTETVAPLNTLKLESPSQDKTIDSTTPRTRGSNTARNKPE